MKRAFTFTAGTGDLWLCLTDSGVGFTIEQLTRGFPDGESLFHWCAFDGHWTQIAGGQIEGRDDAIAAACAALEEHGVNLDALPQERRAPAVGCSAP